MKRITVLLAEKHALVRESLRALLETESDIEVVGEAQDGLQAVRLTKELLPAVVVIDIVMPLLHGLEATRQILKAVPATRVLILSAHGDDEYVEHTILLGAAGYLIKLASATFLSKAIREAYKGNTVFSPSISKRLRDGRQKVSGRGGPPNTDIARLSSREVEVLQLIAEGMTNRQAALKLGISIKTVEKSRQNLMSKLAIQDTAGITRHAIAAGIIESGVRFTIE